MDLFNTDEEIKAIMGSSMPCDFCSSKERCKALEEACGDFVTFVRTGAVEFNERLPSALRMKEAMEA